MEEEDTRRQGVPLGRRFHALYDNKWWKILWEVWKIQTWLHTFEKSYMTGIKISTKRSNFGVRVSHLNWGNNWSMKRKTSVMRVTKPLRWVGGIPWMEIRLRRPHEANKRISWGIIMSFSILESFFLSIAWWVFTLFVCEPTSRELDSFPSWLMERPFIPLIGA